MAVKPKLPTTLLFDLGGVIVPWVGMEALAEYNHLTRAQVSDRFDESEVFRAFERGHASEADFLTELPRFFNLPDGDIAALWNSWVHPPYPGTLEALAALKQRFTLGCLSNTNSLHWAHLNEMFSTDETFDIPIASHELQEAKPDAACFLKALKRFDCKAESVWFFDDTLANITAARDVGLTAFHVDRAVGVLPLLRKLELIT